MRLDPETGEVVKYLMPVSYDARKVVIDNIIRRLNLPADKVFCNYTDVGNTVSASIPIALKDAENKGIFKNNFT